MNKALGITLALLALSACTTVNVRSIDPIANPIQLVCIQENPDVAVDDFLTIVESGFQRHGIRTIIYKDKKPDRCEYTLTYTASRGWDLVPFMKYAELRLRHGDETISLATYKHSGGFALNKWASTASKLDPVLDELLAKFSPQEKKL